MVSSNRNCCYFWGGFPPTSTICSMVFSSYIYYLLCIRDSLVNLCLFLNLVSYISSSKLLIVHPCHCVFASAYLLWDSGCTAFNILRCSHVDQWSILLCYLIRRSLFSWKMRNTGLFATIWALSYKIESRVDFALAQC